MQRRWLLALALNLIFVTSCASYFKRKECEKTNWYQHGFDIAMRGERTDADGFISDCRKVEADINFSNLDSGFKAGMSNYCTEDAVSKRGQDGEPFNLEFCEPNQIRKLKEIHARGIRQHCAKDNGYRVGASGKKYNGICPPELVGPWMPEYNRGRKVYLNEMISSSEREITVLEGEIRMDERDMDNMNYRLRTLPAFDPSQTVRVYDTAAGTYRSETRTVNTGVQDERQHLQWQISEKQSSITQKRNRQAVLRKSISDYRVEMNSLN